MKKLKKCMALLLAAIMVLAMSVTTFAAPATPASGNLTVQAKQSLKGQKIYVFKLFDYTSKDEEAGTHEYTVNDTYKEILKEVLKTNTADSYELYSALVAKTAEKDIKEFANAFAKKVISKGEIIGALDTDYKVSAETEETSYTFTDLAAGYYLVYPAVTEVFQASLVTVDGATTVELKAEAPVPDKEAFDNGGKPVGNVQVGDILTYTVTTKIPDASAYSPDSYKFILKDTLSDGLEFVDEVGLTVTVADYYVKVTVEGNDLEEEAHGFVQGKEMTADLGEIVLANQDKIGAELVAKYWVRVNENATIENTQNSATLEYSNNPQTGETGESVPDVVKTPTFAVKIHKYESGKDAEYLEGAVFTLSKNADGSDPIYVVPVKNKPGYYKVAIDQKKGDAKVTTVSTEVGKGYNLCIEGLKAGTYYLTEVQAPDGFNKVETVKFTIKDTTIEGGEPSFQITYGDNNEVAQDNILKIENRKGSMLPSTGGMGTVIFTVVGAALLIGIGISFVVSRKRKAE